MSSLMELHQNLYKYNNFDIDDNTDRFLDTVGEIIRFQNPSSIGILLDFFEDETDYGFVFQGIISGIESYPDAVYVTAILNKINTALRKYPEWFSRLINRILNDDKSRSVFIKEMHTASEEDLMNLFDLIDREYPQHKILITEFRKQLKSS